MSEKQAKRKRRAARKQQVAGNDGQTTLWQMDAEDHLPAGTERATRADEGAPAPTDHARPARQSDPAGFGPLAIALSAAVPLQVWEFYQQRGPTVIEIEEGRAFGRVLAERGDRLLYRGSKPGETAELFGDLARALAAVCFVVPGGFPDLFGERYDAVEILASLVGEEAARHYCREITERYEADLPRVSATFTVAGEEMEAEALTCDVTLWFDLASDADLLRLRAEDYRGPLPGDHTQPGEEGAASRIAAWAADRNAALSALRERARAGGRAVICSVDAGLADYYCYVHRRKLLAKKPEPA